MTRYDLMHWSQRVRDQQAAARAAQPTPSTLPTSARPPAKPRASRPKPPRDEEAEQLLHEIDGPGARMANGAGAGKKSKRRQDNLIAGSDAESFQGQR